MSAGSGAGRALGAFSRCCDRRFSLSGPAGIINFCANNYLGLSSHPEVIRAAVEALEKFGAGLSSVRFICGTQVASPSPRGFRRVALQVPLSQVPLSQVPLSPRSSHSAQVTRGPVRKRACQVPPPSQTSGNTPI